ncbi:hypothetical protein SARC_03941, partial [Sphaeroforma arctica JP610]
RYPYAHTLEHTHPPASPLSPPLSVVRSLSVVHEMMSILKDEQHQQHGEKLEWIVIWLIGIEIVIGVAGVCATIFTSTWFSER